MQNPVECKDRVVNIAAWFGCNKYFLEDKCRNKRILCRQSERAQKQQHENSNKGSTTSLGSMPITENITR